MRDHSGAQHRLQFHHIFPKAVLKSSYSAREAGGKTNRAISDKPPVGYFPALIEKGGPPVFEAQCIPTDMKLLDVPSYKAFLGERRQIVARRINKFLGTEVQIDPPRLDAIASPCSCQGWVNSNQGILDIKPRRMTEREKRLLEVIGEDVTEEIKRRDSVGPPSVLVA